MAAAQSHEIEAIEAIRASGILNRSQNLQRLFEHLAARHFAGDQDDAKEYTIAVEALNRPAEFDPKKDSIVRVEFHRLRKRLAQYYQDNASGAEWQVFIPEGRYVLRFRERPEALPAATATLPGQPGVASEEPQALPMAGVSLVPATTDAPLIARTVDAATPKILASRRPTPSGQHGLLAGLVLAGIAAAIFAATNWRREAVPATTEPAGTPPIDTSGDVRILAGRSKPHVDRYGNAWSADKYFTGGWANQASHGRVEWAADQQVYAAHREGEFNYDIPLLSGVYELRLHFAETVFGEDGPAGGGESSRLFNVLANGKQILSNFDVVADSMGNRVADVRVFKNIRPDKDGMLHLSFGNSYQSAPFLNAIEVLRAPPGRIRPVRLVAQAAPVRDQQGRLWEPDTVARGGNLVRRVQPPENTEWPELFAGERFGAFRYSIPVALDGVYKVTLYMSEQWFGPGGNGGGGIGSRVFDVFVNHQAVLPSFDLFRSGGLRKAVVKTFHGLRANSRGKLDLSFEPSRNYACVNAIEVEDESPVTVRQ